MKMQEPDCSVIKEYHEKECQEDINGKVFEYQEKNICEQYNLKSSNYLSPLKLDQLQKFQQNEKTSSRENSQRSIYEELKNEIEKKFESFDDNEMENEQIEDTVKKNVPHLILEYKSEIQQEDGSVFSGQMKLFSQQDKWNVWVQHGFGVKTWKDGRKYEGHWEEGVI